MASRLAASLLPYNLLSCIIQALSLLTFHIHTTTLSTFPVLQYSPVIVFQQLPFFGCITSRASLQATSPLAALSSCTLVTILVSFSCFWPSVQISYHQSLVLHSSPSCLVLTSGLFAGICSDSLYVAILLSKPAHARLLIIKNILLIRLSSCHSSKASLPIWLPVCAYPSAYLWLCFLIVSQNFSLFWPCLLVILSTFPTGRGLSYLILILVTVILFIKSADPPCICIQVLGCLCVPC